MRRAVSVSSLVAVLLAGTYGYRAVTGAVGGVAFARGALLDEAGNADRAAPLLDRAAVGFNRLRALLMAGDARLDLWDEAAEEASPVEADRGLLEGAAERYLQALSEAAASPKPWLGLARVYDRLAWVWRYTSRADDVDRVDNEWARVDRSGRVAVGLIRTAIDRAPNTLLFHDRHTLTLLKYGLEEEALEAARVAAGVQPILRLHSRAYREAPTPLLDAFVEAARGALGRSPFLPRGRHLMALGRLEVRRDRPEQAVRDLTEALAEPGMNALNRAETRYWLGVAQIDLGRYEEARDNLAVAREAPGFEVGALRQLARADEAEGDLEGALRRLQEARWADPADMLTCLRLGAVATRLGEWSTAVEALDWARTVAPRDPRPRVALVRTLLAAGDLREAIKEFEKIPEELGEDPRVERVRDELILAGASPGPDRPT